MDEKLKNELNKPQFDDADYQIDMRVDPLTTRQAMREEQAELKSKDDARKAEAKNKADAAKAAEQEELEAWKAEKEAEKGETAGGES